MRRKEESIIQCAIVRWFSLQYPQYDRLFFHVPNGGSRNAIEAVNLKRQGVKRGVSDLILLCARKGYHGLLIEVKSSKGKISPEQKLFLERVTHEGYLSEVVYTIDSAIIIINNYMKGES